MQPNPMPSFRVHSGAKVRRMQSAVSGPYEALFQTIEADYGTHCADALRGQIAPWISALAEESETFGSLTLTTAIDGASPEIAGSSEINAILERIAKREGMQVALAAAEDCDGRRINFQWPADTLAAWRPTLGVYAKGQGSLHIKCRDVRHLQQAKAAVKAAMRKSDFALNWKSATLRAIQSLTAYDGEPKPAV